MKDFFSFQDIEVGESEGRSAPFLISGYSLAGRVSASSLACQDADLSGVDVKMISGGKVLASTKTETSGAYRFSNVAVGSYLIRYISYFALLLPIMSTL